MSDLDDLFTITCGKCKRTEPVAQWVVGADGRPLEDATFLCPWCGYGFRRKRKIPRKPWEPFVELVEVVK